MGPEAPGDSPQGHCPSRQAPRTLLPTAVSCCINHQARGRDATSAERSLLVHLPGCKQNGSGSREPTLLSVVSFLLIHSPCSTMEVSSHVPQVLSGSEQTRLFHHIQCGFPGKELGPGRGEMGDRQGGAGNLEAGSQLVVPQNVPGRVLRKAGALSTWGRACRLGLGIRTSHPPLCA